MAHSPTQESDVQKVYRIARELGISLEDAAVTCDAFELAFSDNRMRRAIFGIIDQLDEAAAKKGEPMGLIIRYTVELGMDGIRVGRYADEIPPGEVASLTPTDRAMIFLKIKDNFPTQQFLGPLIVNRPEFLTNPKSEIRNPNSNCGVVFSDGEITEPEIPTELPSHWPKTAIPLGPIRLKFNERFPFISGRGSRCFPVTSHRLPFTDHGLSFTWYHSSVTGPLPPWAALQAGTPAFQSTSGLSPPRPSENLGHSERKMFLRH
mgnify:CR=1 FL=1